MVVISTSLRQRAIDKDIDKDKDLSFSLLDLVGGGGVTKFTAVSKTSIFEISYVDCLMYHVELIVGANMSKWTA